MQLIIRKGGSEFRILDHTNAVYIAEQWIAEKLVAIEVGGLKVSRGYNGDTPPYFATPSAENFGKGTHDKSFPKRMVKEAWEYFYEVKDKAVPPKGWDEVLNQGRFAPFFVIGVVGQACFGTWVYQGGRQWLRQRYLGVDFFDNEFDNLDNGLDYSDKSFDNDDFSFGRLGYLLMPNQSAARNYFFFSFTLWGYHFVEANNMVFSFMRYDNQYDKQYDKQSHTGRGFT